ncbi:MAG: glycerol-3-phosphate acyltransferase [Acidobacteriia bacterium]|nr:glycerol-3-phosphate acyltransferase [Terriglobia bacterium]
MSAALLLGAAAGFALGSLPFGWLLTLRGASRDVREAGSGNIGATNVLRVAGPGLAAWTLVLDAGKGAAAAVLAGAIGAGDGVSGQAGCLGAVVGHMFTPWLGFRGGKGTATGAGALAVLAPLPLAAALGVFGVTAGLTRRVSAGSLAAAVTFPGWAALLGASSATVAAGAAVAGLLLWSHRANLARLLSGREPRITFGRPRGGRR